MQTPGQLKSSRRLVVGQVTALVNKLPYGRGESQRGKISSHMRLGKEEGGRRSPADDELKPQIARNTQPHEPSFNASNSPPPPRVFTFK